MRGSKGPDSMDRLVGRNIRIYRLQKGVTQTDLADELDLTFQKVQKYEKGTNRVGSGRLLKIATFLDVPVTALFKGSGDIADTDKQSIFDQLARPHANQLLQAFARIDDDGLRRSVVELVEEIASNHDQPEGESVTALKGRDGDPSIMSFRQVRQLGSWTSSASSNSPTNSRARNGASAVGYLRYAEPNGNVRKLPFATPINLVEPTPGIPAPPSAAYTIKLEAGRFGYTVSQSISQTIEPNGVEHVLLTVSSDRSATFDLHVSARTVDGQEIDLGRTSVRLFKPRSARDDPQRPALSQFQTLSALKSDKELAKYFSRVAVNPTDRADLIVEYKTSWELLGSRAKNEVSRRLKVELRRISKTTGRLCFVNGEGTCTRSEFLER